MQTAMRLFLDPRAFNVLILAMFAFAAVRWAWARDWGQTVYWIAAFVLNFAVTYMMEKPMEKQPEQTSAKVQTVEKYQPGNSTDGEAFISAWCGNCAKDKLMNGEKDYDECTPADLCPIIAATQAHSVDDPEYPPEWQYGANGVPCCTAFALNEGAQPPCPHTADMFGGES